MNVSHTPAAGTDVLSTTKISNGLSTARLYLCTDARKDRGDFEQFVDAAFAGGVDIIQLRDKSIEAAEELELLAVLKETAERHGRLWAVNDRADIAVLSGAPVFHIGQKDLPLAAARTLLNGNAAIGLSSHAPAQVDAALTAAAGPAGLDYFCVGPVWATPTKPGRAAVGLELVCHRRHRPRQRGAGGGSRRPTDRGGPGHHGSRRSGSRRRFTPCRPERPRFLTLLAQRFALVPLPARVPALSREFELG
jgi:thiamine-phosphate pyrophosphorylase